MKKKIKKAIIAAIEIIEKKGEKKSLRKCPECNNDEFGIIEYEEPEANSTLSLVAMICLNCGFVFSYILGQGKN